MALRTRLQGRQTQFYIELVYGLLFIGGFGLLAFEVDPRVAAFEGGLVVGYLLRVWEKMSIYERALREAVSEEAETQVAAEVDRQVEAEVEQRVDDEVEDQFDEHVEEQVGETVEERVDTELDDRLPDDALTGGTDGEELPDVDDLVVEDDVEELVAEEVDVALDEDGTDRDG